MPKLTPPGSISYRGVVNESESESARHLCEPGGLGDRRAFSNLFEDTAPIIHAWVTHHLGSKLASRIAVEDIVQEVYCRACLQLADDRPVIREMRSWLIGIARNVIRECLRTTNRMPSLLGDNVPEQIRSEATSITQRVARNERAAKLTSIINGLSEENQQLATICGLEARSVQVAADRLGLRYDAARKRWARLLPQLKHLLGSIEP